MSHLLIVCSTVLVLLACSTRPATYQIRIDDAAQASACSDCHADIGGLLSTNHPPISENDLPACLVCHKPGQSRPAVPNPFSAALHPSHFGPESEVDCTICHSWTPDRHFGVHGSDVDFGPLAEKDMELLKQTMFSWAGSHHLDFRHAKNQVTCNGCHGNVLPVRGDTVENEQCLLCHGSYDALAVKTAPEIFPDRNPHKSHLGEIDCTVCHNAHGESKVYCLECHPKFNMHMPEDNRS